MKPTLSFIALTLSLGAFPAFGDIYLPERTISVQPRIVTASTPVYRIEKRHERRYHRRGAILSRLPASAVRISFNDSNYYYADGEYFIPANNGYVVIAPPEGITIHRLPTEHALFVFNGRRYYLVNDVYYKAVKKNGSTVYVTVDL